VPSFSVWLDVHAIALVNAIALGGSTLLRSIIEKFGEVRIAH
jgi:hypothetical protein